MDNPHNKLLTRDDVHGILNRFGNIGNDNEMLVINELVHYQKAFVHESYFQNIQNVLLNDYPLGNVYINYTPDESNERLEFLGDGILKAVMVAYLEERYPNEREKFMSKLKMKIERCTMLHKMGIELGFKEFLLLSLQVENETILNYDMGRQCPSYYEDAFEAFIGSIIKDFGIEQGMIYAYRFIKNIIENVVDFAELNSSNDNYKDSIQRYYHSNNWGIPKYITITTSEVVPIHRSIFTRILVLEKSSKISVSVQKKSLTIVKKYKDYICEEDSNNIINYKQCLNFITYLQKNGLSITDSKDRSVIDNDEFCDSFKNTSTSTCLEEYIGNGNSLVIVGVGHGKNKKEAEQECAKDCLINFNLDLMY